MSDHQVASTPAERLCKTGATYETITPVRGEISIDDVTTAYAVNGRNIAVHLTNRECVAGRKIGLPSLAVQKHLHRRARVRRPIPLNAGVRLVVRMVQLLTSLRSGDTLLTGAPGPMVGAPGTYTAQIDALGSIQVTISTSNINSYISRMNRCSGYAKLSEDRTAFSSTTRYQR